MPLGQSQLTVHAAFGGASFSQYPPMQLWPRAHSHDARHRLRHDPWTQSSLEAQSWFLVHDEGTPPLPLELDDALPLELDDDVPLELDDDVPLELDDDA